MTYDSRTKLPNSDCTKCKYSYHRHCRKGQYLLPCGSCKHRVKKKQALLVPIVCACRNPQLTSNLKVSAIIIRRTSYDNIVDMHRRICGRLDHIARHTHT